MRGSLMGGSASSTSMWLVMGVNEDASKENEIDNFSGIRRWAAVWSTRRTAKSTKRMVKEVRMVMAID